MCQILPSQTHVIMPRCALLHRCMPDFGCCAIEHEECMVSKEEEVTLYFYSREVS